MFPCLWQARNMAGTPSPLPTDQLALGDSVFRLFFQNLDGAFEKDVVASSQDETL